MYKSIIFLCLFPLIVFLACNTNKKDTKAKDFIVSIKSIKGEKIISSAAYYAGYILCLQEDNKLFVLDTSFKLIDSLTIKFSKLKTYSLCSYKDTILLNTDKEIFYLDNGFVLKKYNKSNFRYGLPFYNDSTYYVYACSMGEFGGSVFFWNQKTNKTYSYPATDVQQVLKFNGNYIACSFLAHMSGMSDYLSIKDPTKLYELKDEKQKTFCNWYMGVDSIKGKKLFDSLTPPGVKYYRHRKANTITTFTYNGMLYSICSTDSATILVKHIDFKLITVDTLINKKIDFQSSKTHLVNDISVTSYFSDWGTTDKNNNSVEYQNTGLIFRKGNNIKFIEFRTPHMWTESNNR